MHARSRILAVLVGAMVLPAAAAAQTFDTAGTRAAGMSGAFVAVADDASAAYWNPGGFAAGSFFSLVLDRTSASGDPDLFRKGSRSGTLVALGAPALGLSYYRLRATRVSPVEPTAGLDDGRNTGADARLDTLVTHHAGATLVQSLAQGLAVGATVKVVRGVAGSEHRSATDPDLLDEAGALVGRSSNRFDADVGVMLTGPLLKVGLTVRNLFEPTFETAGLAGELGLERQVRAGLAFLAMEGWTVAADVDLTRVRNAAGLQSRDVAFGTEGRIARRAVVRGGTRFDTTGDGPGGRRATASVGGSFAVMASVFVDAQVTMGSEWAGRGWGIGARFVY